MRRIATQTGASILGRIVPASYVNTLCEKLGLKGRINLDPTAIMQAVREGQTVSLTGNHALKVKRSRVNGQNRIELIGADPRSLAFYKSLGCFTEIIQWKTRLFAPVEQCAAIIQTLMLPSDNIPSQDALAKVGNE